MPTIKKTLNKEISIFKFDVITSATIDGLFDFCAANSGSDSPVVSRITIELLNNIPKRISIGINLYGTLEEHIFHPEKYYFFKGKELNSVDAIEDITWW
jgi:hypothetical protein